MARRPIPADDDVNTSEPQTESETSGDEDNENEDIRRGLLFRINDQPLAFYFDKRVTQDQAEVLANKITTHGGTIADSPSNSSITLVPLQYLEVTRLRYSSSDDRHKRKAYVEPLKWVDRCIRLGMVVHDVLVKKGMPGREQGGTRTRTNFTEQDDANLCHYIARRVPDPEDGGRMGLKIYKELVGLADRSDHDSDSDVDDPEDSEFAWVARHTWWSWRERYKMHYGRLDPIIHAIAKREKPRWDTTYPRARRARVLEDGENENEDENEDEEGDSGEGEEEEEREQAHTRKRRRRSSRLSRQPEASPEEDELERGEVEDEGDTRPRSPPKKRKRRSSRRSDPISVNDAASPVKRRRKARESAVDGGVKRFGVGRRKKSEDGKTVEQVLRREEEEEEEGGGGEAEQPSEEGQEQERGGQDVERERDFNSADFDMNALQYPDSPNVDLHASANKAGPSFTHSSPAIPLLQPDPSTSHSTPPNQLSPTANVATKRQLRSNETHGHQQDMSIPMSSQMTLVPTQAKLPTRAQRRQEREIAEGGPSSSSGAAQQQESARPVVAAKPPRREAEAQPQPPVASPQMRTSRKTVSSQPKAKPQSMPTRGKEDAPYRNTRGRSKSVIIELPVSAQAKPIGKGKATQRGKPTSKGKAKETRKEIPDLPPVIEEDTEQTTATGTFEDEQDVEAQLMDVASSIITTTSSEVQGVDVKAEYDQEGQIEIDSDDAQTKKSLRRSVYPIDDDDVDSASEDERMAAQTLRSRQWASTSRNRSPSPLFSSPTPPVSIRQREITPPPLQRDFRGRVVSRESTGSDHFPTPGTRAREEKQRRAEEEKKTPYLPKDGTRAARLRAARR